MTVASSATAELSIDRIVLHAFQKASLMPLEQAPSGVQWLKRAARARELLETIIKHLETKGLLARARRFYTLSPLISGQADYALPADILDVHGDAAYIAAGQSLTAPSSEQQVQQIAMEEWQALGGRDSTGVPSMYYADRSGAQILIRLWQTPSEAGAIRFQAYYLLANSTDGAKTPDLERHWASYLIHALAAELAEAAGNGEKAVRLQGRAQALMLEATGQSRARTNTTFVLRHPGPWSRR